MSREWWTDRNVEKQPLIYSANMTKRSHMRVWAAQLPLHRIPIHRYLLNADNGYLTEYSTYISL